MTGNGSADSSAAPIDILQRFQRPVDSPAAPIDILQRFQRPRPRPGEVCELCTVEIGDEHSHLVNVANRTLVCSCRPCYLLFLPGGAGGRRYRAVPDRYLALAPDALSRSQWEGMQVPVGVAFLFHNTIVGEMVAFYPGPAGATESLLSLTAWDELTAANPILATLEPDVEALLIRADRGRDPQCFLVPIDACYELVGLLRSLWKGFDGGQEANEALDGFFDGLGNKAKPVPAP